MKKLLLLIPLALAACTVPVRGTSSMTVLTDQDEIGAKYYEPIGGEISEEMCLNAGPIFLFWWGEQPIHETLLANMIKDSNADALLETEFESSSVIIPYIFMSDCVKISGIPAKRKAQ